MKIVLAVIAICLLGVQLKANSVFNDSCYRKHGFHLLISANPVVLKLSKSNPANLFYSKIRFEPQFNCKRSFFGIGLYGAKGSSTNQINGVSVAESHRNIFLLPTYSYLLLQTKHWEFYTGFGFVYKYIDTLKTTYTSLETLTRKTSVTEIGASFFGRLNYRFNRRVSMALEIPIYLTQINSRIKENYPLTPSMSSDTKGNAKFQSIYFIPSNIYLRISI
jgi:hypothetical protein